MTDRDIDKDTLLKLADFLDTKALPENFDMGTWGRKAQTQCGFAGCAIGWGIKEGIVKGLKFQQPPSERGGAEIVHGDLDSFEAVQAVLRLTQDEAEYLFGSGSYRDNNNPKLVAVRIRDFVETEEVYTDEDGRYAQR